MSLDGKRFGRWTVIRFVEKRNKNDYWECLCDCGTRKIVFGGSLRNKRSESCGCLSVEKLVLRSKVVNRKHGLSKSRFFYVYKGMIDRCTKPYTNGYHNYGGRGIKVCDRWSVFQNFVDDMHESYLKHAEEHGERNTTLERINRNGNYSKENCRWATVIEQHNNTRTNRIIELDGKRDTLANWCRKYDQNYYRVSTRLALGWDPKTALTKEKIANGIR